MAEESAHEVSDEVMLFEHELLTAANAFAEHWEKLGPPTGAGTCAFVLLAARTFASSSNPLSLEEFVELATSVYKRAKAEVDNGDLVDVDAAKPPTLN